MIPFAHNLDSRMTHMTLSYPCIWRLLIAACLFVRVAAVRANDEWTTIENDDPIVVLAGSHEIPKEYEHSKPSGTITSLSAGSLMAIQFRGTRVAVFVQGGPYQCGDATIELDGRKVGRVQSPFLPVDRQVVWVSDRLPHRKAYAQDCC